MPIIILRDKDGQRVLPIWVGVFEANAIALQIDAGVEADVAKLVETATSSYGGLDVAFANAGIIGDIPAHRVSRLLAEGVAWQRSAARRLGMNAAEFATEESGLVTSARDLTRFGQDVDQLRDDAARLEKRISML